MVQESRISARLGLHAYRLLQAKKRLLMGQYRFANLVPVLEAGPFLRVVEKRKNGTIVRTLGPVLPKNDRQALEIIAGLSALEPLVDQNLMPTKEQLPKEDSVRWPWVELGLYYYDPIGRIHWKQLNWDDETIRHRLVSHFVKVMRMQGKEPWDIRRHDLVHSFLSTLFRKCPKTMQTFYIITKYGDAHLKLADLTRFKMSNNFHEDQRLQRIYVVAIAHRVAEENKKITSYSQINGPCIARYGNVRRNACGIEPHKFKEYLSQAIEQGIVPRSMRTLRHQLSEGTALGVELIVNELENMGNQKLQMTA